MDYLRPLKFDGERLRLDMTKRGWNSQELARQAGVTPKTVYRFLSGEVRTAKMAKVLAEALGYPIDRYIIVKSKRLKSEVA